MVDMSATDEETAAQSNQFIGWYEGYHGRDGEMAELKTEIERLRAALGKIAHSTGSSIFQDIAKNALEQ